MLPRGVWVMLQASSSAVIPLLRKSGWAVPAELSWSQDALLPQISLLPRIQKQWPGWHPHYLTDTAIITGQLNLWGTLVVIWSTTPAQVEPPAAGCPGPCPESFSSGGDSIATMGSLLQCSVFLTTRVVFPDVWVCAHCLVHSSLPRNSALIANGDHPCLFTLAVLI